MGLFEHLEANFSLKNNCMGQFEHIACTSYSTDSVKLRVGQVKRNFCAAN